MALRFRLSRQQRFSIVAVVFIALALGMPSRGYAASPEQRFNALGAACLCSEPLEMTDYTVLGGGFHYNPNDSTTSGGPAWMPSLDCCNCGPGWANQASIDPLAQFTVVGHWYRYEVVLRNQTGAPGAILQAFRKDVTANTPEVKIIDTTVACAGCGTTQDWTGGSGATTALTPPGGSPLTAIEVNLFRNAGTNGSCAGYRAYSYILVAAWGTDAGQRIGAAAEIEGGAVTSPSPSPP